MVREKTMTVVIPAAMITASVSYFMLTYQENTSCSPISREYGEKYREERFTMPRMIPSVIVKVASRMKLIGKLLKTIG